VFGQHIHAPMVLLVTAEYVLAALAFMFAVSLLLSGSRALGAAIGGQLTPWVFLFSTSVVFGITAVGLYQPKPRLNAEGVIIRLIAAIGLAILILALTNIFVPVGPEGPLWALSFLLSFMLLGIARLAFAKFVDHDAFRRQVLVYGAGDRAASILNLRR